VLAAVAVWLWVGRRRKPAPAFDVEPLALSPADRVLVLAPHPDDETVGCGGVIQQCVAAGIPVRIVFFTNGDNNELSFFVYRKRPVLEFESVRGMGLVRHDEAVAAAGLLGVAPTNLVFLGYPDSGTLRIWLAHWGAGRPRAHGPLTLATAVPYAGAFRQGAPYKGEEIVADLASVIRVFRPTRIFVSHPADQNPDHRALYLFTRVALWDLEQDLRPELLPYLVHFHRWPQPRGYHPEQFLAPPADMAGAIRWRSVTLSSRQMAAKRKAIRAHRTQCEYAGRLLFSFVRARELFGDYTGAPSAAETAAAHGEIRDANLPAEPPEELSEDERAAFIGIRSRHVRIEGANLVVDLELSQPLDPTVASSIYVFGYRHDRPFAEMPKLQIRLSEARCAVLDQAAELPADAVRVVRQAGRIGVSIPLAALGGPQRVLTSVRTSLGFVPLDQAPWRVLTVAGSE